MTGSHNIAILARFVQGIVNAGLVPESRWDQINEYPSF